MVMSVVAPSRDGLVVANKCPHCGGRLFLVFDVVGKRSLLQECLCCSREYYLSGVPVAGRPAAWYSALRGVRP